MRIKNRLLKIRLVMFVVTLLAVVLLAISYQAGRTSAAQTANPMVLAQVLDVDCPFSAPDIGSTFAKVQDIGAFNVQSADSLIEITFNSRLSAGSMTGNGIIFELRVDDLPSTYGRARALLRNEDLLDRGNQVSMTGIFNALAPGEHTLSLWAYTTNSGSATDVQTDPGCFHADHAVVKEFLPFGTIALPVQLAQ